MAYKYDFFVKLQFWQVFYISTVSLYIKTVVGKIFWPKHFADKLAHFGNRSSIFVDHMRGVAFQKHVSRSISIQNNRLIIFRQNDLMAARIQSIMRIHRIPGQWEKFFFRKKGQRKNKSNVNEHKDNELVKTLLLHIRIIPH